MLKQLFLVRHAEAEEKAFGQPDKTRGLTSEGRRHLAATATFLASQEHLPDRVLCSDARRAVETCAALFELMSTQPANLDFSDAIHDADSRGLLEIMRTMGPGVRNGMVIGHNPAISRVATALTGEPVDLRPGSVAVIGIPGAWTELGEGGGRLIRLFAPQTSAANPL